MRYGIFHISHFIQIRHIVGYVGVSAAIRL